MNKIIMILGGIYVVAFAHYSGALAMFYFIYCLFRYQEEFTEMQVNKVFFVLATVVFLLAFSAFCVQHELNHWVSLKPHTAYPRTSPLFYLVYLGFYFNMAGMLLFARAFLSGRLFKWIVDGLQVLAIAVIVLTYYNLIPYPFVFIMLFVSCLPYCYAFFCHNTGYFIFLAPFIFSLGGFFSTQLYKTGFQMFHTLEAVCFGIGALLPMILLARAIEKGKAVKAG